MSSKSILVVTFFFPPNKTVGSLRASYWCKNLHKHGYEVSVVSSTSLKNIPAGISNYICIPLQPTFKKHSFIKDEGLVWGASIKNYFNKIDALSFNSVLITGGPFLQFGLIKYFKKTIRVSNVVLDYRDPFSFNPRFNTSIFSKLAKELFNQYYLYNADHVITTNYHFQKLIDKLNLYSLKISLIDNGFDETIINKLEKKISIGPIIKLGYLGPFMIDRDPSNLISSLDRYKGRIEFHHIGSQSNYIEGNDLVISYGQKIYHEAISIFNNFDVGLILLGNGNHESTTKVFDYIGLRKPILIITNGKLKSGPIHTILKEYPLSLWAKNNEESISSAFNNILSLRYKLIIPDRDFNEFSRKSGLVKLVTILNHLNQ